MIVIKVAFNVKDDQVEEARAAFLFYQDVASAEDGCISFRFYQDLEDATRFLIFEEWETQEALEAHWKAPAAPNAPKWPERVGEPDAMRYEVSSFGKLVRS